MLLSLAGADASWPLHDHGLPLARIPDVIAQTVAVILENLTERSSKSSSMPVRFRGGERKTRPTHPHPTRAAAVRSGSAAITFRNDCTAGGGMVRPISYWRILATGIP